MEQIILEILAWMILITALILASLLLVYALLTLAREVIPNRKRAIESEKTIR